MEQCFGVMKKRFRAFAIPLQTRIDHSMDIIVAIARMHNLAIRTKQPSVEFSCDQISEPEHQPPYDMQNLEPEEIPPNNRRNRSLAEAALESLLVQHFSH